MTPTPALLTLLLATAAAAALPSKPWLTLNATLLPRKPANASEVRGGGRGEPMV